MTTASQRLGAFADKLRLEDVPDEVVRLAKVCIADTVACGVYGARFPWSRKTALFALRYGGTGPCTLFGVGGGGIQAPLAALANGASVHAFEQDSLRFPGAGVHPGAALVPTIAAACQDAGASGATALRAFVAGCEVLFRVGAASHHSSEKLGFHAPGLTGVYGAAVSAAIVYQLDSAQIGHALGIAGSMSAGVLAFTKSDQGAMVKRLHMGRACEAGILAARLAKEGYTGPETILEGRFGYLDVYCRDGDPELLTGGLGVEWETSRICLKRYACHVTAHAPLQALRGLMHDHGFDGEQVVAVALECTEKVVSHHDIREPQDVMQAQYSVSFCLALALYRDPLDPASFDESALGDDRIRSACRGMSLVAVKDLPSSWSARLSVTLKDGRRLGRDARSFKGMPDDPLSDADARARFDILCSALSDEDRRRLHQSLYRLDEENAFPSQFGAFNPL